MSTTPVTPNQPTTGTGSTTNGGLPTSQSLNNMFLQLLVAQLQNQDPLNPLDPSQFVGQLAQFSELSEVTQINQTLQQLTGSTTSSGSTGGSSPATGQAVPAALVPSNTAPTSVIAPAISAAQSALQNFAPPVPSILNHQIQGVF